MKKRGPMEYALYLLSRKPRTEKELVIALKKRGVSKQEIDSILEKLKEWKYVDDLDYAKEFVKVKMKKIYGPPVIKSELLKRGVKPGIAEEAIKEEFDEDLVLKLAVERARKMLGRDPDEKTIRKVWNFFARRGLPASDILQLAREN